ncbi:hypothetical protein KKD52_09255 [Myxococcota bacterium]|nr:hypothetical protein [Myxococcota bacterium]MBU1510534.1 hypothetical protein [Myxococcota bacterium]
MFTKKGIRNLAMLMAALLISACYKHVEVKPTELAKLNHAYSVQTGTTSRTTSTTINGRTTYSTSHDPVYSHSDIPMEKPDGRIVSIKGKPDAIRITARGQVRVFEKPFIVEPVDDGVILKSANWAATSYPYADITKSEVKYYDGFATVSWMVAATLVSLLVMFVVLAPDSDDSSYKKTLDPTPRFSPLPGWRF